MDIEAWSLKLVEEARGLVIVALISKVGEEKGKLLGPCEGHVGESSLLLNLSRGD